MRSNPAPKVPEHMDIFDKHAGIEQRHRALLSIGGAFPWWSLAIFALCVWVTWGIIVFGEDEKSAL